MGGFLKAFQLRSHIHKTLTAQSAQLNVHTVFSVHYMYVKRDQYHSRGLNEAVLCTGLLGTPPYCHTHSHAEFGDDKHRAGNMWATRIENWAKWINEELNDLTFR